MVNRKHQAECVQLITACQQRLSAYIRTMLPNNNCVDDILQETNLVLWEKIDSYEPGTNFNAWAYKVAYFQTLAYLKKEKRRKWLCFDSELMELLASEIEEFSEEFNEEYCVLKGCIEKLNSSDKQFIKARYYDELSLKEISIDVNRSVGALKQVMFRIRKTLKQCVQRNLATVDI